MIMKSRLCALVTLFFVWPCLPVCAETSQELQTTNNTQEIRALLVPVMESVLSSQISGHIQKINVHNGDSFNKGQKLIIFNCDIQKAKLQKAEAESLAARKQHEANLRLKEFSSISQVEIDISGAQSKKARAEVAIMRAMVSKCTVRAPFNGRVVKLNIKPFESVSQSQPLIEILDDSQLKLDLYVPSHWVSWLQAGTPFIIHIEETGKNYTAVVKMVGAKVDATSQTITVTGEIEKGHKDLLAGMSGVATFKIPE